MNMRKRKLGNDNTMSRTYVIIKIKDSNEGEPSLDKQGTISNWVETDQENDNPGGIYWEYLSV